MAILKVARLGHPVLRQKTEDVTAQEIRSAGFQKFLEDMVETMRAYEGVGLAANQVHVAKQVAVLEVQKSRRYPDAPAIALMVLINPEIISRSSERIPLWEGCLSIPDMRGMVPRHESLVCRALDPAGEPFKFEAKGFLARVIQHEWDHLQGNVYLDRMENLETLTHLDEFGKYWLKEEE